MRRRAGAFGRWQLRARACGPLRSTSPTRRATSRRSKTQLCDSPRGLVPNASRVRLFGTSSCEVKAGVRASVETSETSMTLARTHHETSARQELVFVRCKSRPQSARRHPANRRFEAGLRAKEQALSKTDALARAQRCGAGTMQHIRLCEHARGQAPRLAGACPELAPAVSVSRTQSCPSSTVGPTSSNRAPARTRGLSHRHASLALRTGAYAAASEPERRRSGVRTKQLETLPCVRRPLARNRAHSRRRAARRARSHSTRRPRARAHGALAASEATPRKRASGLCGSCWAESA